MRHDHLRVAGRLIGLLAWAATAASAQQAEPPLASRPNFIVFLMDDVGYADIGTQGAQGFRTPNFDRIAAEGVRMTDFYVHPVCGVTRAALMTGCYAMRVAEAGNRKHGHPVLHPEEITLAETLGAAGYATALVGKWHLAGSQDAPAEWMPNAQGFGDYFGTPVHNGFTKAIEDNRFRARLMRDEQVLDESIDQQEMDLLTRRYTEEACQWIRTHRDEPFFLYLAHNMAHVVLGASEAFRGSSDRGLYGDAMQELDWSAGQIVGVLKELGLDERTLMVVTSDNGPWVEQHLAGPTPADDHYGRATPLRGFKMTTWEGGVRVPCLVRWPGTVPAGRVVQTPATVMDLYPTFAALAAAELPSDRILDGRDLLPTLLQAGAAPPPHDAIYYYAFTHLQAVRSGAWKLVLPRPANPKWCSWSARMIDAVETPQLYDLETDLQEQCNVAAEHPEIVARLMTLVERARADLGDYDRIGSGQRFFDDGPRRGESQPWLQTGGEPAAAGGPVRFGAGSESPATGRRPTPVPYDKAPPVGALRFDFESGDLQGWRVVEGAFDNPVCDRASLPRWKDVPFNKQGQYHLSTVAGRTEDRYSDAMTGVLQSPWFRLRGPRASFLVGGGNTEETYVALCNHEGKELLRASGTNSPVLRRVAWDVIPWTGDVVCLRIVDRRKAGWGHVTFDDFSADAEPLPEEQFPSR